MDWFSTADAAASLRFGWVIGTASGLYLDVLVILLIVSAPAYREDVPRSVGVRLRKIAQWALTLAPTALFVGWVLCGYAAQSLARFGLGVSLAMLCVAAPLMLLVVFSAANRVGEVMVTAARDIVKVLLGLVGILAAVAAGVGMVVDYGMQFGAVVGLAFGSVFGPSRIAGVDFRQWYRDPGTPSKIADDSWIGLSRGFEARFDFEYPVGPSPAYGSR
jgi:uncharacterized membrane protein YhdT